MEVVQKLKNGLWFDAVEPAKLSPAMHYVSGSIAGAAATIGSYPFDLLRTIMASQGEPKVLHHSPLCFSQLLLCECSALCRPLWSKDFRHDLVIDFYGSQSGIALSQILSFAFCLCNCPEKKSLRNLPFHF